MLTRIIATAALFVIAVQAVHPAPVDDFVTTWNTGNFGTSSSTSITIPTTGTGYDYDVDWDNDGVFDELGIGGDVTHDFGVSGTYTIRIQGAFPRIFFNLSGDRGKILAVDQWGTGNWSSMSKAFYGASNLLIPATDIPDFSATTDMSDMFRYASRANPDTSSWDVSAVTNMYGMFWSAYSANPDTSAWDVSDVKNMSKMFWGADSANPNTSAWDVSAVLDMSFMFASTDSANPDTSAWDVSAVINMRAMFASASSANPDTSAWDVSAVTDMSYMFASADSNPDTSTWDVSAVTNMTEMFQLNESANPDTSSWDVSSITNMSFMFQQADSANPDTSTWDVSSVTDMKYMFDLATSANPDTSSWDVSAVTDMRSMFYRATSANPDTSAWDVSAVTDMGYLFAYATSAIAHTSTWDVSAVISMAGMFNNATSANPDTSFWDVSAATTMSTMFYNATSANPDTSFWDVSSVTNMGNMFSGAVSANPDTSSWDVAAVTSMSYMFRDARSANPDVSAWDVSAVRLMRGMFDGSSLSISNYDALLINWNGQALQSGVRFHGGSSLYCSVSAQVARANLIEFHGWEITDGGLCEEGIFKSDFEGFQDCAECPLMAEISGGAFDMGNLSGHIFGNTQLPVHSVTVQPFAMGVHEVTVDQWDACFYAGGCTHAPYDGGWGGGYRPVINVNWDDVQEYVAWISDITGKNYRLPSESEWEYAARAGSTTVRWWGDQNPECTNGLVNGARFYDWTDCHRGIGTAPVGSYSQNAFGLYDVLGNVKEWTEDCWHDDYIGAPSDGSAWTTGDCFYRVRRGGSWDDSSYNIRSSVRDRADSAYRQDRTGFRIARDLD